MKKGFTLIELLVVVAILGILATVGLSSFRTSQIRSRDAKRKSDLEQVQRALEMYFNDKRAYPVAVGGAIGSFAWGDSFVDPSNMDTIYMKELPQDPSGSPEYCYQSFVRPAAYKIYAKLEMPDPKISGPYSCGGGTEYNYGVTSSNINLNYSGE